MGKIKLFHLCIFAFCGLFLAMPALAHPEGYSGLRITVGPQQIKAVLTLHTRDMSTWFPPAKYPDYVSDVCRELGQHPQDLLEISIDEQALAPRNSKAFSPETGMIEVDFEYARPLVAQKVQVWSKHIIQLPRGHQQLLFVDDDKGKPITEDNLTTEQDAVVVELPSFTQTASIAPTTAPVNSGTRISFFALGVEHILTGYDHLLFLAAFLLVCHHLRQALTIITWFTLAHSVTLALAALNIVHLSSRIVEPAIAATIVYVAFENLFGHHRLAWRAAIAFGFGLIHGLGFASALQSIGLGSTSEGVLLPLVKFNLGVEAGQLSVAMVLLPTLWALKKNDSFKTTGVVAGSLLVAAIGGYWMVIRLAGG